MDVSSAVVSCVTKYATFRGRALRSEFWYFFLFCFLVGFGLDVLERFDERVWFFYVAFHVVTFLPSLAVNVRRLHDIDRSGWWLLLLLVPIVGLVIVIVWTCMPGTDGPNRFGDPDAGLPADTAAPAAAAAPPPAAWPQRTGGPRREFGLRQYQR